MIVLRNGGFFKVSVEMVGFSRFAGRNIAIFKICLSTWWNFQRFVVEMVDFSKIVRRKPGIFNKLIFEMVEFSKFVHRHAGIFKGFSLRWLYVGAWWNQKAKMLKKHWFEYYTLKGQRCHE